MKCPFCAHLDTQVVETRLGEDAALIRRRRRCNACDKRFTTYERPEVNFPAVIKKDGRRVEFTRNKLQGSFTLALRKRPISADIIAAAMERIEEMLLSLGAREIASDKIGGVDGRAVAAVFEGLCQVLGRGVRREEHGSAPVRSLLWSSAAGCVPGGRGVNSCRPRVALHTSANE